MKTPTLSFLLAGLIGTFVGQANAQSAYYTIQPNATKDAFIHTISWVALDTQYTGSVYDDPLTTGVNEGVRDKITRDTSFGQNDGSGSAFELHAKDNPLGQVELIIKPSGYDTAFPAGNGVEVRHNPGDTSTNSWSGGYIYLGTDGSDGATAPAIATPKWDDVGSYTTDPNGVYGVGYDSVTGFRADNSDGTGATTTDIGLYIDTDDVDGASPNDDVGLAFVGFAQGNPQEAPNTGYVQMVIPVASGSTTDTYFEDPNGFWPESGWKAAYVEGVHTNNASIEVTVIDDATYTPKIAVSGDFDGDLDVDTVDLAIATGNNTGAAVVGTEFFGQYYRDGDTDDDGDVDNADLGAVIGAIGGVSSSGSAELTYDTTTGNVTLDASAAAGTIITSFQLENAAGTFVSGSYTSLSGGDFGGTYEDTSADVLGDSDPTLAGFSGIVDLGNVLPSGMDLAGLQSYLTTAFYTGSAGSGQQQFDYVVTSSGMSYSSWQTANNTSQTIDQDHDGDGVKNGVEYFLGGATDTTGYTALPSVVDTAGTLSITWTMAADYSGVYGTDFEVETSETLTAPWTPQAADPDPGFTVTFPSATEVKFTFPAGTKNFARLSVTGP